MHIYRSQYQKNLSKLIKAWASFRVEKTEQKLREYSKTRNDMSSELATYALFALQQVLFSLDEISQEYKHGRKKQTELIQETDWLMNQLIRANQEEVDPFLLEAEDPINDVVFDKTIHEHSRRLSHTGGPLVAVIDDQETVGKYLCKTLQDFNLNVMYYNSVDAFKQAMKKQTFDLVLLDIVMPNISQEDVFAFAAELVKQNIKVISCSSTFTFETRLLAVRAKVTDYVVKPVNTYVLVEKIGRALSLQQNRNHRVVIIDDQETMGEFYKTMLERIGCNVMFFSTADELFASLEDINPDMFLLDMMMPDVDGLEVAKMIRQEHKFDFAPILFLTADETTENRLAAIDAGADDVISKGASVHTITHQVNTRLNRASKVRSFVAKDPLTGVLNHGQIVEVANQTIRLSNRRNTKAAIAVIDVDKFKLVNDEYGHVIGDKVLTALGQLLSSSIRDTDSVGRYGGEEFVIIFQDCSVKDAADKVLLIKNTFASINFSNNASTFAVTFSAGVCSLNEFESVQPAIATADKALYKAKDEGRNKVIAFKSKPSL